MNKIRGIFFESKFTLPCWCFRQTFMTTIISFVRKVRSVQLFCSRIDTIYLEPDLNMYCIKLHCHLPNVILNPNLYLNIVCDFTYLVSTLCAALRLASLHKRYNGSTATLRIMRIAISQSDEALKHVSVSTDTKIIFYRFVY